MNLNTITTRMFWQNEDDEQENKEEKSEQLGAMMMKKLDTLFFQKNLQNKATFYKNNCNTTQVKLFSNFFSPSGLLLKNRLLISKVISNINYTLYYNNSFLLENYPHVK